MSDFLKKNCVKRALRTFVQTAIGYLAVNIAVVDFSADKVALKSCLVGLGVSAVSAGVSAVMNLKDELVMSKGKRNDCTQA